MAITSGTGDGTEKLESEVDPILKMQDQPTPDHPKSETIYQKSDQVEHPVRDFKNSIWEVCLKVFSGKE